MGKFLWKNTEKTPKNQPKHNKTILFAIYLLTGALNLPQVQCSKFLFIFIFYRVAVDLNFCPSLPYRLIESVRYGEFSYR
jgi:hypothetical protein